MSKLFYRLNSLSKYLNVIQSNKLLDESLEPIVFKNKSDSEIIEEYIKLFSLLDLSYNVQFIDKYKELTNIKKMTNINFILTNIKKS